MKKKKGDARMRELGMKKVSFWLSPAELTLVRRAKDSRWGTLGALAHRRLILWAEQQTGLSLDAIRRDISRSTR